MSIQNSFINACLKHPIETVPVWYMRQAGRYDPDYRKIKEKYSLLEICAQPERAPSFGRYDVRSDLHRLRRGCP